jgi:hypothetical protein
MQCSYCNCQLASARHGFRMVPYLSCGVGQRSGQEEYSTWSTDNRERERRRFVVSKMSFRKAGIFFYCAFGSSTNVINSQGLLVLASTLLWPSRRQRRHQRPPLGAGTHAPGRGLLRAARQGRPGLGPRRRAECRTHAAPSCWARHGAGPLSPTSRSIYCCSAPAGIRSCLSRTVVRHFPAKWDAGSTSPGGSSSSCTLVMLNCIATHCVSGSLWLRLYGLAWPGPPVPGRAHLFVAATVQARAHRSISGWVSSKLHGL